MNFHVDSEVGELRQVILHRPGLELLRLTPSNVDELLFDDVMWADRARQEHDAFAARLRARGVKVHYFADLFAQALDEDGARDFVMERVVNTDTVGSDLVEPLRELFAAMPSDRLAEFLIGGILKKDLDLPKTSSLWWSHMDPTDFALTPVPNTLFQRDNTAFAYGGLSVHTMNKPARKRELIHSRTVWNFHPLFRDADLYFYGGNDDISHEPATVEGGDILVIGNGTVMIGMGERTTPQGISELVRGYFSSPKQEIKQVIVVELPKKRALMHLDTALTMIDVDKFSMYPYLPVDMRSWTLTKKDDSGAFDVVEHTDHLWNVVADALGLDKVYALQTPIDEIEAEREQWDDGNNFLAVAPGVIFGYERNTTTNRFLEDHGITIEAIVGSELGRGRGGPRCMSCPIERYSA